MPEQHEGEPVERPENPLMALSFGRHIDPHSGVDPIDEALGHASLDQMELSRRVTILARQADRMANHIQGLPTREDYDALLAEHAAMREKLNRLDTLLHSFLTRAA